MKQNHLIRDFPDQATFREKGAKLACTDKLGVFLSLTLCKKADVDPLQRVKYHGIKQKLHNGACVSYILKVLLKIKGLLIFFANGRAC